MRAKKLREIGAAAFGSVCGLLENWFPTVKVGQKPPFR